MSKPNPKPAPKRKLPRGKPRGRPLRPDEETEVVTDPEPETPKSAAEIVQERSAAPEPEAPKVEAKPEKPKPCAFLVWNKGMVPCGRNAVGFRAMRSLLLGGAIGREYDHPLCAEHLPFVLDAQIKGFRCDGRYVDKAEAKRLATPDPKPREPRPEPAVKAAPVEGVSSPERCPTCGKKIGHASHGPKVPKAPGQLLEVCDPAGVVANIPAEVLREAIRKLGLAGAGLAVVMRDPKRRSEAYYKVTAANPV